MRGGFSVSVMGRTLGTVITVWTTRLSRLRRLAAYDFWLLGNALLLLGAIRVGLFLLPLKRLHRLLVPRRPLGLIPADNEVARLVWAVRTAAPRAANSTCLPQALALQILMHRRGAATSLYLGFHKQDAELPKGHAWLEWREKVLIGGSIDRFTTVLLMEAK